MVSSDTYYIKLFRTSADRHNGILMPLLFLVAETINHIILLIQTILFFGHVLQKFGIRVLLSFCVIFPSISLTLLIKVLLIKKPIFQKKHASGSLGLKRNFPYNEKILDFYFSQVCRYFPY